MAAPIEPLKGEELFRAPPAKVYHALTDLDALSKSIPDLTASSKVDARTLQCTVKPGFSFVRGTLKLKIELFDLVEPSDVNMKMTASGIGMGMESKTKLKITPEDGGKSSKLVWETHVTSRSGLLSLVSPTLIQGTAEKTIKDGWETLRKRVEA